MPLALNFYTLFVKASGNDDAAGDIDHGTTEASAFASSDAALLHAKTYLKFTGRLNVVMLKFANDRRRSTRGSAGPGGWARRLIRTRRLILLT